MNKKIIIILSCTHVSNMYAFMCNSIYVFLYLFIYLLCIYLYVWPHYLSLYGTVFNMLLLFNLNFYILIYFTCFPQKEKVRQVKNYLKVKYLAWW